MIKSRCSHREKIWKQQSRRINCLLESQYFSDEMIRDEFSQQFCSYKIINLSFADNKIFQKTQNMFIFCKC